MKKEAECIPYRWLSKEEIEEIENCGKCHKKLTKRDVIFKNTKGSSDDYGTSWITVKCSKCGRIKGDTVGCYPAVKNLKEACLIVGVGK